MGHDARLEVRVPSELLERLPQGRKRSVFVREALEAALEGIASGSRAPQGLNDLGPSGSVAADAPPVSPRRVPRGVSEPPAPPGEDGSGDVEVRGAPTVEQIHNRCGVPKSLARMWVATGEWEKHWP